MASTVHGRTLCLDYFIRFLVNLQIAHHIRAPMLAKNNFCVTANRMPAACPVISATRILGDSACQINRRTNKNSPACPASFSLNHAFLPRQYTASHQPFHSSGIRSENLIENWFIAKFQQRIGIVHFFEMFARAK